MHRREALLLIGAAGVGGYVAQRQAGLLNGSDEGADGTRDTATPTPTASGTAEAPSAPGAATATPADDSAQFPNVGVGKALTLGDVSHTVRAVYQADKLGTAMDSETASGVFVVAVIAVANNRKNPVRFPDKNLRLRQGGSWSHASERFSRLASSDKRVEVDAWTPGSIGGGSTRVGVSAWDAQPDRAAGVWILPPDNGNTGVVVSVGKPSSLDYLQGVVTE